MFGIAANKATVLVMMLATFLPVTSKPEAPAFITPLAPILGSEKADAVLKVYDIRQERT
jgi:hypothetical protein